MSLLDESMEKCAMYDKVTEADGYGGVIDKYIKGAEFKAAIFCDTSIEARAAQQQGLKNVYTVTTSKNINLQYHNVFQRLSDGKFFRATSDGDDKLTPDDVAHPDKRASVRQASYRLDMRQVTAEDFTI